MNKTRTLTVLAATGLGIAALAGCGGATAHSAPATASSSAADILRADGYQVTTVTQPSQGMANLGDVSLASGVRGNSAEQVIITSGHPTAPICQSAPATCSPAYMASQIPSLDPGAQAHADGLVLRITGTVATFTKDGIPL